MAALHLRAKPNARRNELLLAADGTVTVRLQAPLHDGKANDCLLRFLADVLEVPSSSLVLLAGHTAPFKKVDVPGFTEAELQAALAAYRTQIITCFLLRRSAFLTRTKPHCMAFPLWLQAGFWGLVSGSALLIGAAIGYFLHVPQRLIAAVMAFGSGVLISTLSLELMEDAYRRGGFDAAAFGFVGGAAAYTLANWLLARHGAKHRKRSGHQQHAERQQVQAGDKPATEPGDDNGMALAIGALLDGIPESIVIGLSMLAGGAVSTVAVVAIFLSNLPEGLSSAAGMKKAGRTPLYVLGLWASIALVSGVSALVGFTVFSHFSPNVIGATTAVAAGAVLAMIADTMIPEAFEVAHNFTGLITVLGFLAAFVLSKLGG
ncbi:hypothetical protein F0P96_11860 [Hymenobacter busanensis]|uniref:UPF0235 protein F0P96_11860 n=1 Tax=Hymenobacter busanensis TaxID=2607656 RepID=A0A7L4ZWU1_9BACT|nr:DUF167 family protein [Hymenobacter busanensis]KAA9332174.1 hypothetical protein F0P96_11860 [Hymenobacter busanensis]QHJ07487.1 hypothetical protein GUY19_09410 [Hymenobacter busanensis]